jgi:hypothetical protein
MTDRDSLRVFINANAVDVPRGASALDAVTAFDTEGAAALRSGEKILTDSRGLPFDVATEVQAGAIFRLIPRRDRSAPPKAE